MRVHQGIVGGHGSVDLVVAGDLLLEVPEGDVILLDSGRAAVAVDPGLARSFEALDVDYERIQVKDVADEAGVALGTLYRYFNSKDHLFALALLDWASGFRRRVEKRRDGPTLIEVPVGPFPSPWEFIQMPKVRGK